MKPVQRDNAALFRLNPIKTGIVGIFRHRKDAGLIGAQKEIRRDEMGVFFAPHGQPFGASSIPPVAKNFSNQWMS